MPFTTPETELVLDLIDGGYDADEGDNPIARDAYAALVEDSFAGVRMRAYFERLLAGDDHSLKGRLARLALRQVDWQQVKSAIQELYQTAAA